MFLRIPRRVASLGEEVQMTVGGVQELEVHSERDRCELTGLIPALDVELNLESTLGSVSYHSGSAAGSGRSGSGSGWDCGAGGSGLYRYSDDAPLFEYRYAGKRTDVVGFDSSPTVRTRGGTTDTVDGWCITMMAISIKEW